MNKKVRQRKPEGFERPSLLDVQNYLEIDITKAGDRADRSFYFKNNIFVRIAHFKNRVAMTFLFNLTNGETGCSDFHVL